MGPRSQLLPTEQGPNTRLSQETSRKAKARRRGKRYSGFVGPPFFLGDPMDSCLAIRVQLTRTDEQSCCSRFSLGTSGFGAAA